MSYIGEWADLWHGIIQCIVIQWIINMIEAPPPIRASSKQLAQSFKLDHPECPVADDIGLTVTDADNSTAIREPQKSFTEKLLEDFESPTFTKALVAIFIVNALQLIVFFTFFLVIQPTIVRKKLDKNDILFIIDNMPDSSVDYGYFLSLSTL